MDVNFEAKTFATSRSNFIFLPFQSEQKQICTYSISFLNEPFEEICIRIFHTSINVKMKTFPILLSSK